jgi:hypothetical protein
LKQVRPPQQRDVSSKQDSLAIRNVLVAIAFAVSIWG